MWYKFTVMRKKKSQYWEKTELRVALWEIIYKLQKVSVIRKTVVAILWEKSRNWEKRLQF